MEILSFIQNILQAIAVIFFTGVVTALVINIFDKLNNNAVTQPNKIKTENTKTQEIKNEISEFEIIQEEVDNFLVLNIKDNVLLKIKKA